MKTGLIGEKLGHSFSKIIHERITHEPYDLISLTETEFHAFMKQKAFDAINVTIPYKEAVIPYCDEIDEKARAIQAVNAIKQVNGKWIATNTDFGGLKRMIENHFDLENKKIAICGTGGTSKTAIAVAKALKAKEILIIGRHGKGSMNYEQLLDHADTIEYLINTTNVGMYPNIHEQIVDLKAFTKLQGVIDVVYNPLRTALCVQAKLLGIPAINGLEMLVGQAIEAIEFFRDIQIDNSLIASITREIVNEKRNLVLIGLPSCGKTTLGLQLAQVLGYDFVDCDDKIKVKSGLSIPQIFEQFGEEAFRDMESEVCEEVSCLTHTIISCGGGIIKREENIRHLALNGIIIYIDRHPSLLISDDSRPLSSTPEKLNQLVLERTPLYEKYCDIQIKNNHSLDETLQEMIQIIQ